MHHVPSRPPRRLPLRRLLRRRWALRPVLVAAGVVGVLAVAVPMVSDAAGSGQVAVDASSTPGDSPVVMGVDGAPGSATTAAETSSGARPPAGSGGTSVTQPAGPAGNGTPTTTRAGDPPSAAQSAASGTSSSVSTPDSTPSSAAGSAATESTPSSPTAGDPTPSAAAASVTDAVLALVNRARAGASCDPLRASDALTSAATTNSRLMAEQGTAAVVDLAGSAAAVASGAADAGAAVAAWLADPAASAHLLDCSLTTGGAAEATGDGGPFWTLFLA